MADSTGEIIGYHDAVNVQLTGPDVVCLMGLLERKIGRGGHVSHIEAIIHLYKKLKKIFDENWKKYKTLK